MKTEQGDRLSLRVPGLVRQHDHEQISHSFEDYEKDNQRAMIMEHERPPTSVDKTLSVYKNKTADDN